VNEVNVLVEFGSTELPGKVVDRVVIHAGSLAGYGKDILIGGRLPLGHIHVGTACAADPESRAAGRLLFRLISSSRLTAGSRSG